MLTPDLLRWRPLAQGVEPAWLAERDDVWLRELLNALDARVGRAVGNVEREVSAELEPVCREQRVDSRALRGAIRVALKGFSRVTASTVAPEVVRRAVFERAARTRSERGRLGADGRTEVLMAAAQELGLEPAAIEPMLYADYPKERILEAPDTLPSPAELRDSYQLALLQGFLLRSAEVGLWLRSHVRAVARFAKLSRLLCSFTLDRGATRMDLSGPLAIFHATLKYGRALASFIPTVASTPGWQLEAKCVLPDGPILVLADSTAPLPRTHALPRDTDSKLEARLARDLRRARSAWTLRREAAAFQIGPHAFFPDFVLERGRDRVVVEVVGYWTPEYLASKLRVLGALPNVPLVVAVDRSHGVVPADLPAAEVITFEKRIEAAEVLAAAERAARRASNRAG
ncbi:MAG: DUF790 family protein [Myxococcales bacterium]|nr:DUF790 family protein [Myxococcales bacterium]